MLPSKLRIMIASFQTFRSDRGTSLVEYAMLIALITVMALGAITYFGNETTGMTSSVSSEIVAAQSG